MKLSSGSLLPKQITEALDNWAIYRIWMDILMLNPKGSGFFLNLRMFPYGIYFHGILCLRKPLSERRVGLICGATLNKIAKFTEWWLRTFSNRNTSAYNYNKAKNYRGKASGAFQMATQQGTPSSALRVLEEALGMGLSAAGDTAEAVAAEGAYYLERILRM